MGHWMPDVHRDHYSLVWCGQWFSTRVARAGELQKHRALPHPPFHLLGLECASDTGIFKDPPDDIECTTEIANH